MAGYKIKILMKEVKVWGQRADVDLSHLNFLLGMDGVFTPFGKEAD